ncbi:hypothetical protein EAI_12301 [Harpegnathos saltator]|uniref:Uncharacterized protein n=1 Tax=Harpegnathos saltator TaxID=610380 RepID=E2BST7_HARSA|nr:hypothetical protein EAI_12301 [Harpegnathos saltator]
MSELPRSPCMVFIVTRKRNHIKKVQRRALLTLSYGHDKLPQNSIAAFLWHVVNVAGRTSQGCIYWPFISAICTRTDEVMVVAVVVGDGEGGSDGGSGGGAEVASVNPPCYSTSVTSRFAYAYKNSNEPFIASRGKFNLLSFNDNMFCQIPSRHS